MKVKGTAVMKWFPKGTGMTADKNGKGL